MLDITEDLRPICSCDNRMKLVKYTGYYEDIIYWECNNIECTLNEDNLKPDYEWSGEYV